MKDLLLLVTKAELGGAQRSVLELATRTTEKRHRVTIGTGEPGWLRNEAEQRGIATWHVPGLERSKNPLAVIQLIIGVYRFLKKNPHRVVHLNSSNTLPAALSARLAGANVIFTARGLSMLDEGYELSDTKRTLYALWFWWWFWWVDTVVCVSTRNAERLEQLGVVHAPPVVIPNGLNALPSTLTRDQARAALHLAHDEQAVVLLGRLEYAKRHEVIIDAWDAIARHVPTARLIFIGDGPEEETLKKRAKQNQHAARITWLGAYPNAAELLIGADIVILPSRYEGWPVVLLEALLAERPIIASDVGGIAEMLGEAGIVLPAGADASVWADAIQALLKNTDKQRVLADAAGTRAAHWSSDRMMAKYEALYAFSKKP